MAQTDINICSQALVLLGADPISNFNESDAARTCGLVYPTARDAALNEIPWRFTIVKEQLTRKTEKPIAGWENAFIIPGGGTIEAIYETDAVGAAPSEQFTIYGRDVYSNREELWADVRFKRVEAEWPIYFYHFMIAEIASLIAFDITDQQSTADRWAVEARGTPEEARQGGRFGQAAFMDAAGDGQTEVNSYELIEIRSR